jgi:Uma2 family endonuclease
MSTLAKSYITPEEYLAIEGAAERKSEYFDGQVFAMAGASEAHNRISVHTASQLDQQLSTRPCRVYASDMRVCVDQVKAYTYPDVVVVRGERKFVDAKPGTLLNPTVIIEVLSPSTELYDRNLKFAYHRSIESLQAHVLLASDRVHAELYTRDPKGGWHFTDADQLEDVLNLDCLGCALRLADLYHKVEF